MRPVGTQRPERPKSELSCNKYEKYGRCKARNATGYNDGAQLIAIAFARFRSTQGTTEHKTFIV
jgi:hypothetical protein